MNIDMKYFRLSTIRISILLLCIFSGVISLKYIFDSEEKYNTVIKDVCVESRDSEILLSWDVSAFTKIDYIEISVLQDDLIVKQSRVSCASKKYSFIDGEHGELYLFRMIPHIHNGENGDPIEKEALFLKGDRLPNLPVIQINTVTAQDPSYEQIEKREEEWLGGSIKDNSYIGGEIHFYGNKVKFYDGRLKIKVHGNTSALSEQKKPYKIQLSVPFDLIGNKYSHAAKEWILLANGNSLNTYIGTFISRYIGLEWQPEVMLVNVMINGDWKGCYYLSEAINPETSNDVVTKDGAIFENDAYWWKGDRAYFKTKKQYPQMGYTIKYPEVNEKNSSEIEWLALNVQRLEDAIEEEDNSYQYYIDENTFIKSIMVKDILGIYDGAGSNMFFYVSDISSQNDPYPRICMGPVWDFDSAFSLEDYLYHQIAFIHFLKDLFQKESFYQSYLEIWDQTSVSLYKDLGDELKRLLVEDGQSIQQSWQLDAARWKKETQDFSDHIVYVLNRLMIVKNTLVQQMGWAAAPFPWDYYLDYKWDECNLQYYIDETSKENGIMTIKGWAFGLNQENTEISDCEVCISVGNHFYRAIRTSRKDVSDLYGFSDERIGFFLNIDLGDENCGYIEKLAETGMFYLIDEKNKILYRAENK